MREKSIIESWQAYQQMVAFIKAEKYLIWIDWFSRQKNYYIIKIRSPRYLEEIIPTSPDGRSWFDLESMPSNCYQIASHFRDLGLKCVASSLRGTWGASGVQIVTQTSSKIRKCHNLSIICLSNTQLSPNLLRQRGFVIITMQTEVSWIKKSSTAADNV